MVIDGTYAHGGDIYQNQVQLDFSANVNPYGTPKPVRDAVTAAAKDLAAYPDPYCGPLRAKLAEQLGIAAEDLLCGELAAALETERDAVLARLEPAR